MHEAFINIADIPTHVMAWGPWIEESFERKEVVICITGNPGLVGFYTKFLSCISDTIGHDIPVWIVGLTGHDEPPANSIRKVPLLAGNEHKYGLQAQVEHKAEFIRQYVPHDVKIHLIGHSVGAWIITELLKDPTIQPKVQHSYLLFPAIERLAASKNGVRFVNFIQPFWFLIRYFFVIFSALPLVIRTVLMSVLFFTLSLPQHFIGTALKYAKPSIIDKVVYMAGQEMKQIVELNVDIMASNREIIKLYYGKNDGWVPPECVHQIRDRIPNVDAVVDDKNINHAFVLKKSEVMGSMVGEWILEFKRN